MSAFVFQTLNALSTAGLLFLVAAGFSLIFGVMKVVNLAHGALYLLGGYMGLTVLNVTGNFWLALGTGGLSIVAVGFGLQYLMRIVEDNPLAQVLLSIGVAVAVGDIALGIWGGLPKRLAPPEFLTGPTQLFGGIFYPTYRLFLIGVAVIVGLALWAWLGRTMIGTAIRAGVDDIEMVQAIGVRVRLLFGVAFAVGALLAGTAGVLGGAFLTLYPNADWEILVLALVVVVIGGLGSLGGAAAGSVLVGMVDAYGRWLIPEMSYFVVFLPMALLLVWRPTGLFGKEVV